MKPADSDMEMVTFFASSRDIFVAQAGKKIVIRRAKTSNWIFLVFKSIGYPPYKNKLAVRMRAIVSPPLSNVIDVGSFAFLTGDSGVVDRLCD